MCQNRVKVRMRMEEDGEGKEGERRGEGEGEKGEEEEEGEREKRQDGRRKVRQERPNGNKRLPPKTLRRNPPIADRSTLSRRGKQERNHESIECGQRSLIPLPMHLYLYMYLNT